MLLSKSYSNI